eukprot:GHVU01138700.1.p1 GENE.GHVU01138700.1~~GHVU01138700.1.p1  ORF type:complete len:430 (+),score=56.49 GHVU01138700.1:457-1746(+)
MHQRKQEGPPQQSALAVPTTAAVGALGAAAGGDGSLLGSYIKRGRQERRKTLQADTILTRRCLGTGRYFDSPPHRPARPSMVHLPPQTPSMERTHQQRGGGTRITNRTTASSSRAAASGFLFIQMEYCPSTLEAYLGSPDRLNAPVAVDRCVTIARDLLRALDHCHAHGIIHRDVKAENVFIDAHGEVKLGDFGLACLEEDCLVATPPLVKSSEGEEVVTNAGGPRSPAVAAAAAATPTGLNALGAPPANKFGDARRRTSSNANANHLHCLNSFNQINNRTPVVTCGHSANAGTRIYAAPEQLEGGAYSRQVDMWAYGLLLLELFHRSATAMERVKSLKAAREASHELPQELERDFPRVAAVIRECVQMDPQRRPTSYELLQRLELPGGLCGGGDAVTTLCDSAGAGEGKAAYHMCTRAYVHTHMRTLI